MKDKTNIDKPTSKHRSYKLTKNKYGYYTNN